MHPTIADFNLLIEELRRDRSDLSVINFNDIEESTKLFFSKLTNQRHTFYDSLSNFPAYKWITSTNKVNFDRVKTKLLPDHQMEFSSDVIKKSYANNACKRIIDDLEKFHKKGLKHYTTNEAIERRLLNYAVHHQKDERIIAHIAECYKRYLFAQSNITPSNFNKDIDKAIKSIEKANEDILRLEKYSDIFFKINIVDDPIQQRHLDVLREIRKSKVFPVSRVNDQHQIRMFIVFFIKHFLISRPALSYHDNTSFVKQYLPITMNLLSFDCFENSMAENNVRNAIKEEIQRENKDSYIYRKVQRKRIKSNLR